ncbi:hypothetical protein LX76_02336 [Cereibacter changlensis]|uniref:Uncharacterized protein n=1 Tax=Cereibacter changlensis TaxID=402884 RepID=A0A2W7RDM1_9RHOB|nr:hypothetical protein LX76_02336 [Cereibacter changlensis]
MKNQTVVIRPFDAATDIENCRPSGSTPLDVLTRSWASNAFSSSAS